MPLTSGSGTGIPRNEPAYRYPGYAIADDSDADGGDKYIYDGSHGCVNTPEAAMKIIYDDITIGTPVVLY